MSIKARLRIAIVALVALVVFGMSALYLFAFTSSTFKDASERADFIAKQVKNNLVDHLQRETAARGLQPSSLEESRLAWTEIIRGDPKVTDMLKRAWGDETLVADILVTDEKGRVLAAAGPTKLGAKIERIRPMVCGPQIRTRRASRGDA